MMKKETTTLHPSDAPPKRGEPEARAVYVKETLDMLIDLVAHSFDVSADEVRSSRRCKDPTSRARQIAVYLAHVGAGFSLSEIGPAIGRDRTTASYACRQIEELRDDPDLEFLIECMERNIPAYQVAYGIGVQPVDNSHPA